MGKVKCQAESSKLRSIFPGLGDRSLELILSLVGVLIGFPFLGLEAYYFLLPCGTSVASPQTSLSR